MNSFTYIFDLNHILKEEDIHIPHVDGLHYNSMSLADLSKSKIVEIRDVVMSQTTASEEDKHLFFFVIENEKEVLNSLSKCFDDIQGDHYNFRQDCELHVVCNFIRDGETSFNIQEYEKHMPSLKRNEVCVYSWLLDKYEHAGYKPVSDANRAHAIARLIWMLSKHYTDIGNSLLHTTLSEDKEKPIYNLFGDSCLFFDEEKRSHAMRDLYCFKNIQHLLNLPDKDIDEYIQRNKLPSTKDKKELEKIVDATSEEFLKQQRVPFEATLITEKTQGLLLKSSDEDDEYLVCASDNKLVFLEELRDNKDWQLDNMETFLTDYQKKVQQESETQEVVSADFLKNLYKEKYTIHEREGFNIINNTISKRREVHIDKFKKQVDNYLNGFLNQQSDKNYNSLQEILTKQETLQHHSNIDFGIAFMEYLESGKGDYLTDQDISMGDINFTTIKDFFEKEEQKRCEEYESKKNEINGKYGTKDDGQPSQIKKDFDELDNRIKQRRQEKKRCDFQIDHWIDEDADKKLTARSKSVISFVCGLLAAIVWVTVSMKYLSGYLEKYFEHYGRFQWEVFGEFILAGLIIGAVILAKALRRRKEAEKALEDARQQKCKFMNSCVEEMKDVTEKHYEHLLSYHGLKTMKELMEFVAMKKEDLVNFRKTLFKKMLQYKLPADDNSNVVWADDNTIELKDREDLSLLFGPEGAKRSIPYCFAHNSSVLSNTFAEYRREKARWETTRFTLSHTSQKFDKESLEKEIIACMSKHKDVGLEYTSLKETSVLPADKDGVEMEDINQGACGDCYFMATLAAIACVNPEYIIGKNGMIEELGEEHRFFRVKFHDKDGKRVNVDVDNRFWNLNGRPYYAKQGKSNTSEENTYDPWVMAVEKAWAKANDNGYDGINGTSISKESMRRVEYSFAVTGKSAFYCWTKKVPDENKLLKMMKKHFLEDHLPITLYSASEEDSDFSAADPNLVHNHAYALQTIHDDDTFDIFNPWNSNGADEDVEGKHFEKVNIKFIKNNFDVVVFFGIQEADFDSFERDLTQNVTEDEMYKSIEKVLHVNFDELSLNVLDFEELMTEEDKEKFFSYSNYLFNRNKIRDVRGVDGGFHLAFFEGGKQGICDNANEEIYDYLKAKLPINTSLQMLQRDDDKQCLTLFRLSPHYVLDNFQGLKDEKEK